ncbi:MAG: hypothetical protein V2A76_12180 [Planctomycetota bacterium]
MLTVLDSILTLSLALPAAQDAELIERPSHGFVVARPAGEWLVSDAAGDQPGSLNLILTEASSGGKVKISVLATPAGGLSAEKLRENAVKIVAGQPQYSNVKRMTARVLNRKAPGLDLDAEIQGEDYRARLVYLVEKELAYLVQVVTPIESFEEFEPTFQNVLDSLRFVAVEQQGNEDERLLASRAKRCGTEFRWVESWEEASRLATKERRLILVYARLYGGLNISDDVMFGPFMDRDVVALLEERFVALRLTRGMDLPLRSHEVYGLSPTTFGTSFLVCDPAGGVVGEEFCPTTPAVHDLLLRCLEKRPKARGATPPPGLDSLERAVWHYRRGELDQTEKLLSGPESGTAHQLRAGVHRRRRQGPAALASLDAARRVTVEPAPDLVLDEALVRVGMGELETARGQVEQFVKEFPEHPRALEARFTLGGILLAVGSKEEAGEVWRTLALETEESRWAKMAAAGLASTSFRLGVGGAAPWPKPELLEALVSPPFESVSISSARKAQEDALAFLLAQQRPDGSWIGPSEAAGSAETWDNQLTTAISAICARSLIPHGSRQDARAAVLRALGWFEKARARTRGQGAAAYYMDYSIYANAYEIRLLADALDAGLMEPEAARAAIAELVDRLRSKQKDGGGWSYYLTPDLESDTVLNQSISFITAAATIALVRARESGVELPVGMLDKALDCLEQMRNDNLTFEYFLFHEQKPGPRGTRPPGAAGRGPVCALALVMGERRKPQEIREMLGVFFENEPELSRERGKALMHCGLDGQGSHYVMFNYSNCAQAIGKLPDSERARFKKDLLKAMLGARTADGAFLDNPLLGRPYGAAQALVVFHALGI